ncbi:hypothetical protein NQ318_019268 [Aromia moschata]|uniref:Ig-like domain-containing protein n=1 Tax=Aromia moschata TaxID=1265417 RepID=A0AAV8YXS9_9CUCU|nr:hypothetical protein NQ318_019268 [Aromia moschata]
MARRDARRAAPAEQKLRDFLSTQKRQSLNRSFVPVPPSIIDRETSSDMVVLESTNVSLTCKATGYPEPYVMWRREDGEDIRYNGENAIIPTAN